MFWKVEPLSPRGTPSLNNDEEWLDFDEKPVVLGDGDELFVEEQELTRAQIASRCLEALEHQWIKEGKLF